VLTVPILDGGRPIGAITLERDHGPEFEPATVALGEAICALVGPTLRTRVEGERWFAGRFVRTAADWRDRLIGPGHQSLKVGVAVAVLVLLFLAVADGEFRVAARTTIEGSVQRAAVAPYDGFIRHAPVRAGATVRKGDLLAEMDDRDLRLDHAKWAAEREQVAGRYGEALAKRERAAVGIIAAQLAQAESQLALAEEKLARTRISAPFDGLIVSGDLSQSLGAPVEKGKVLFELAPLDAYRVALRIDERDVGFVRPGQRGELALSGIAGETLPFVVRTVTAVSTPQDGRNFFRVEAQLDRATARLRPGMEGVGKVSIEKRSLVWIWTRNFVDWLRLSLWNWTP
jgi:RND family efflux transporter MFP subunit